MLQQKTAPMIPIDKFLHKLYKWGNGNPYIAARKICLGRTPIPAQNGAATLIQWICSGGSKLEEGENT
jgi:hypothetical protein